MTTNAKIREEMEQKERERMEEERQHNDHERRIQWTLNAYSKPYDTALNNLENVGTTTEIREHSLNKTEKEYKIVRSYIDRIEIFAKGFGLEDGEKIYDMDTFKQISSPYFSIHIKPRASAFLNLPKLLNRHIVLLRSFWR